MTSRRMREGDPSSGELAWLARRASDVAKTIKGLLLGLAAALGLELTTDPGAAALALAGSVVAVVAANVYGDALQYEIVEGRQIGRGELRRVVRHSAGIALGASPPLLLFVGAWLGLVETEVAVDIVVWGGVVFLAVLGYAGGRLGGDTQRHALFHGSLVASLGLVVVALKSLH